MHIEKLTNTSSFFKMVFGFFFFKFKHFKKQFKYTLVELVDGEEMKGNGFF